MRHDARKRLLGRRQAALASADRADIRFHDILGRMAALVGHIIADGRRRTAEGVKIVDHAELGGDLAADRVFQQLTRQLLFQLLGFLLVLGQQHDRLDIDEPRRHRQEFRGDIHLILLHAVDLLHVLVEEIGDLNIVDIDLVLGDQAQQQVERTLKHGQLVLQLCLHSFTLLDKGQKRQLCQPSQAIVHPMGADGQNTVECAAPHQHEQDAEENQLIAIEEIDRLVRQEHE